MTLRLTLRTLLSYLDDTLEPAQAKAIGAKVAESEQARELMERITQVTRRRRLMTPPTSGPGGIDANTIAEYLDNDVTPEQAAEVEQICLASDVHLAEVAACHQILTLVLGEPALVPPSAKQRMYGLVKGPESIPFRKPAKFAAKDDQDLSSEIESDQDETLRLGVPAVGQGGLNRNLLLLVGGGVLAACLLVVAVWQLVSPPPTNVPDKGDQLAQGDKKDDSKGDKKPEEGKEKDKDKGKGKDKDKDKENPDTKPPKQDDSPDEVKVPNITIRPVVPRTDTPQPPPFEPASAKQVPIGQYVTPGLKEPSVLLQPKTGASGWVRLVGKNAAVSSGRPLLSLPGSKSVIALETGVELTLWGNLPEVTLDGSVLESRATVHALPPHVDKSLELDADLTLERGRIILRNKKKDGKDALVRVRFDDPTQAKEEFFDVTLFGESAIVIDRSSVMDRNEPFYDDPKAADRKGPIAIMKLFAYEQSASILSGSRVLALSEGQQPMLQWQSRQGLLGPPERGALPNWLTGKAAAKDAAAKMDLEKSVSAHLYLAKLMETKPMDVAFAELKQKVQADAAKELVATKGMSPDTFTLWRHAIRCLAAVDDISTIYYEFSAETTPMFIRAQDLQTLQQWIALHRDHDQQLLNTVKKDHNNNKTVATNIMHLFHSVSSENARKPATYQYLIEGLNNDLLPIRTLSHWHLIHLAPSKIVYDPAMPRDLRLRAMREWAALITSMQAAPDAPPTKKDKK